MRPIRNSPSATVSIVLILAFSLALPARSEVAPASGSFMATGVPWANMSYQVPSATACGVEGVHMTTTKLSAPLTGVLTVTAEGFVGDWDVFLMDASNDEWLAWSAGAQLVGVEAKESAVARVRKGQGVNVIACNWASPQPQVEVRYQFTPGDGTRRATAAAEFRHLSAGGMADLRERVPVHFVFVGYSERQVDKAKFLAGLPKRYKPVIRSRGWYNQPEYLGIDHTFDYRTTFTDTPYENTFFNYLKRIGKPVPLTAAQTAYNNQTNNVLNVTSNLDISAPKVERWLGANPPPGVDTTRNTVFFINWYGRKDFRFHVYRKKGEAFSGGFLDAGARDFAAMMAWGGTPPWDEEDPGVRTERVWFYDLSAGPETWTSNWNVDTPDLTDDGIEEYRMPPIWEYRTGGYRAVSALTADLAKVARYVAIDLLFTTSPIYPPALAPPALPDKISLDLNSYEGNPNVDASSLYIKPHEIRNKVQELLPLNTVDIDSQDLPFWEDPEFNTCWQKFGEPLGYTTSCYTGRPYVNWQSLYLHNALNASDMLDDRANGTYEVGAHTYFVPHDTLSYGFAYADDNQRDDTQSMVHWFPLPSQLSRIGATDILIHEFGHHFGMSHPHDGYDYEEGIDFGPGGRLHFAWVGDESNTIMTYLPVNNEFSQFDLDNRNRWMAATYLTNANKILASLLRDGDAALVRPRLLEADAIAGRVARAFADHDYLGAYRLALSAYRIVRAAAAKAGISVTGTDEGLRTDAGAAPIPDHAPAALKPSATGVPGVVGEHGLSRADGVTPVGQRRDYAVVDRFDRMLEGIPILRR